MPEDFAAKVLTAVQAAQASIRKAHRTWLVQPHLVDECREIVEREGMSHLISVEGNIYAPKNAVLVFQTRMLENPFCDGPAS